jgi:hypothetical protein
VKPLPIVGSVIENIKENFNPLNHHDFPPKKGEFPLSAGTMDRAA